MIKSITRELTGGGDQLGLIHKAEFQFGSPLPYLLTR
jgi:hypothetical protein